MSRTGITVAVVASAGVIVAASASPPPRVPIHVPAIELSASAAPLVDVAAALSAMTDSGPPSLEAVLDLAGDPSNLAGVVTTLARIATAAGVALTGVIAAPYSLLSVAVTSLGTAISDLGGVFTSIGTAVSALAALPGGIAELIETAGTTITQGIVTPVYDFLIKLVSGADPTSGMEPLPDLTQSLDPGAVPDFPELVPDLPAVF